MKYLNDIIRTKPSRADDDLENYEQMFEKIAVATSGGCSLAFKTRNAQNAGILSFLPNLSHSFLVISSPGTFVPITFATGAIGIIIECTRQEIDDELLKLSIAEQSAEWEEKNRIPEYERRSTIRIPVVLIEV